MTEHIANTEEINLYKEIDGALFTPIVDAHGSFEGPEYAIRLNGFWQDREADGVSLAHVFDIAHVAAAQSRWFLTGSDAHSRFGSSGSLSSCGGPLSGAVVVGARNGLDGPWTCESPTQVASPGHGHGFVEAAGRVWFADESKAASWSHDGDRWELTPFSLGAPNVSYRDEVVSGEAVYIAVPVFSRYDFAQVVGTLTRFDGTKNALPIVSQVVDIVGAVDDSGRELAYVLRRLHDGSFEFGEVDLNEIGPADYVRVGRAPEDAWSIGFVDGHVYIGAKGARVYRWDGALPGFEAARATRLEFTAESATAGQYADEVEFEAVLTDDAGAPISGAAIRFALTNDEEELSQGSFTNSEGLAMSSMDLFLEPGLYSLTAYYGGQPAEFEPSSAAAEFEVMREASRAEISLGGKGSSRYVAGYLLDGDTSDPVVGRSIEFSVDGEVVGTGTTDSNGYAQLPLPPKYREGHHDYEIRFAGDRFFLPSQSRMST